MQWIDYFIINKIKKGQVVDGSLVYCTQSVLLLKKGGCGRNVI